MDGEKEKARILEGFWKEDEIQFIITGDTITGDTSIACINNTWTRYRELGSSFPNSVSRSDRPYGGRAVRAIVAWRRGVQDGPSGSGLHRE